MNSLAKLDFTDPLRQGGKVGDYQHGDEIDFMKYYKNDWNPDWNAWPTQNRIYNDGEFTYFSMFKSNPWGTYIPTPPYYPHFATANIVSKEWLPRNFLFEMWGGYHGWDDGEDMTFAIIKDCGYDYNYALLETPFYRQSLYGLYGFQQIDPRFKYCDYNGHSQVYAIYKKTTGVFQQIGQTPIIPNSGYYAVDFKRMVWRRNEKIIHVIHKRDGSLVSFLPIIESAQIENGLDPDRLFIGMYPYTARVSWLAIYQLLLQEYREYNAITEAQVQITTDGTISGAPDAKTAITAGDETSYITLAPGKEIIVNMTSGDFDCSTFCVELVSDCTDTNKLSVAFATAASYEAYSGFTLVGNGRTTYDCGDKIAPSWFYTMKHIFGHTIKYLLQLNEFSTIGFKKMKIRNESAITLRVFLAKVLGEPTNSAIYTPGGTLTYMHVIDPDDAPLGTPGTVQTLKWRNSSGFEAITVKMSILDDGSPLLDGLIQYSADNINWYDTATPPPGGSLLLASNVPDGDTVDFYIRTNLPLSDPQLASFIAKFQFEIQT